MDIYIFGKINVLLRNKMHILNKLFYVCILLLILKYLPRGLLMVELLFGILELVWLCKNIINFVLIMKNNLLYHLNFIFKVYVLRKELLLLVIELEKLWNSYLVIKNNHNILLMIDNINKKC